MRSQTQLVLGVIIILMGVLFLIGNLFDVDVGAFCWPIGLIVVGLWLLLRPQIASAGTVTTQKILVDIERMGPWQVDDEEFLVFIADMDLDMTKAAIPLGETRLRAFGFVGDIELLVPEEVGVAISSTAFVSDVKMVGRKEESILSPLHLQSDNYKTAERKIHLDTAFFVADLKIRQV
jgi:predicted membrane protein